MKHQDQYSNLIAGLRAGRRQSMMELMGLYGSLVQSIVGAMVRDRRDVEELVQDVFIRAIDKIGDFDEARASLTTWIGRIARNRVVDHLRHHKCSPLETTCDTLPELSIDEADSGNEQLSDALLAAIDSLKADDRAIITLAYFNNLPLSDIAGIFNTNPNNISSRLYRIRQKLASLINEQSSI